jgi:hypothetical protein
MLWRSVCMLDDASQAASHRSASSASIPKALRRIFAPARLAFNSRSRCTSVATDPPAPPWVSDHWRSSIESRRLFAEDEIAPSHVVPEQGFEP